jgi:hypothetical protein
VEQADKIRRFKNKRGEAIKGKGKRKITCVRW